MYRTPLTIAALLLASVTQAGSYETSTLTTPVPDDANGSLQVRDCSTCPLTLVRLNPRSRFKIGRDEVTFDEFRSFVRKFGDRYLHVDYDDESKAVIRLQVDGQRDER